MGTHYSHLSSDDSTAIQALVLVNTRVALIAERLGFMNRPGFHGGQLV